MVNKIIKCRICDSPVNKYETFENVSRHVSVLKKEAFKYQGQDVTFYKCDKCNHYQIEYDNSEDYYDDYIMLPHADSILSFRDRQIKNLHNLNTNATSFIEIGCGDGGFLKHASEYYTRVVGNEPSKVYNKLTVEKGFECFSSYIDSNFQVTETFDSFCAKQVFEHLPNPKETLTKIFELLNEGGVGFIEIPNGAKTMYDSRYFDIFTDHVNYFTPSSLAKLAEGVGFVVVKVEETFGGDYLECYVKKQNKQLSIKERRTVEVEYLKSITKQYTRVGAFGAGAKGFVVMTALENTISFDFIFDNDPHKTGKYLPNTDTPITYPEADNINSLNLIIIFAASYQDEVVKKLRNEYNYKGAIVGLQYGISLIKNTL